MVGDAGNEALEEPSEAMLHLASGLENFLMAELSCTQTRSKIGDAGDAEDFNPHVAGDNGFGHGGHSNQRGAHGAEGTDLGGGLEAGPAHGQIDALGKFESFGCRGFVGQAAKVL